MTQSFMENPLVVWVQTFKTKETPATYEDLTEGVFLNHVIQQIDQKATDCPYQRGRDLKERLRNWSILLKNLKLYYQDVLQQLIIMKIPNIVAISKTPESDASRAELLKTLLLLLGCAVQCEQKDVFINNIKKLDLQTQHAIVDYIKEDVLQQLIIMKIPNIVAISKTPESDASRAELLKTLLLLLGCAVQCEQKDVFINNIKKLDLQTQHAIVDYIKEITDETRSVFAVEVPAEQMDEVSQSMFAHLQALINERDGYIEEIADLTQTVDEMAQAAVDAQRAMPPPVPVAAASPEKHHHLAVELAECKAKLRKLRTELEEKTEQAGELQDELDEQRQVLQKLRVENLDLAQDARSARAYRDELDVLKESASRVEKYEQEITKYKEKLIELEFYKTRVEELREENHILVETKGMLEEQLETSHRRVEAVVELESEMANYKANAEKLSAERDAERLKLQTLLEENARLEYEKKSVFNESANLEEELQRARSQLNTGLSNSLNDQLNETANAKILRLQLENQRLSKRLEEMQQSAMLENTSKMMELEKENNRLAKKVENLQTVHTEGSENMLHLEHVNTDLERKADELSQTIDTIRETSQRQVTELERENESLQQTVEKLRERNEKTQDLRMKDVERENKRLHDNVQKFSTQVSAMEYENRQLTKQYQQLSENVSRMKELEDDNQRMERHNEDLRKHVTTLKLTCDKYEVLERENCDYEVDNRRLQKLVDNLKNTIQRMEAVEQDNINLTVEVQHLKRGMENSKYSTSRIADLESEKDELNRENQQLQRALNASRDEKGKQEQLEMDLLELDTENQKLQRQLEAMTRRVNQVEQENAELDAQIQKLNKSLETMKPTTRKLEDIEKEYKRLEEEHRDVTRDKATADKENRKLRQTLKLNQASLDEVTSSSEQNQQELKELRKAVERNRDSGSKVREFEKENAELVQQVSMDKKTLNTLREDLVKEKIKNQQLDNELEKLSTELEKVGISKEKLIAAEHAQDESKYKALESMMEEAFKSSMHIKEDKITALESRLDESKARNQRLQEELKVVKREYEAVMQRREEETPLMSNGGANDRDRQISVRGNTTKEILDMKDHLIELERSNATLEADNRNIRAHNTSLKEKLDHSSVQHSQLNSKYSGLQGQNNALQGQLAKAQVENTTLQSQIAALHSQLAALQHTHSLLCNEHDALLQQHEDSQQAHAQLVADHESLQKLHEQLAGEYDSLIVDHGQLKTSHKTLKQESKEQRERYMALVGENDSVQKLKVMLQQDREQVKSESKSLGTLQLDYLHVKEENIRLRSASDNINKEYNDLLQTHKTLKGDFNQLQLRNTELQGMCGEYRDQLNALDIEITKLANKCESVDHLNTKLEEENHALMMQLQALLNQNQELLTQTMDSKDHFHNEQRAYRDRLHEMQRQKEKLEEKIMEQYKRQEVKKKNKGFGANLVRKAKQIIRGNRVNKERPANRYGDGFYSTDSPENSSMGSGSATGDHSDSPDKRRMRDRRGSHGDLTATSDSPRLTSQSKLLAKSTTALSGFSASSGPKDANEMPAVEVFNQDSPAEVEGRRLAESASSGQLRPLQARGPLIGDDDEGLLSLEQFLRECDRSPRSRKRLLKEKNVSLDKNNSESKTLSPQLGARSATMDKGDADVSDDDDGFKSSMMSSRSMPALTLSQLSQSATNVSVGSYSSQGSGGGNVATDSRGGQPQSRGLMQHQQKPDLLTSTPKHADDDYSNGSRHSSLNRDANDSYGSYSRGNQDYAGSNGKPHQHFDEMHNKRFNHSADRIRQDYKNQSGGSYGNSSRGLPRQNSYGNNGSLAARADELQQRPRSALPQTHLSHGLDRVDGAGDRVKRPAPPPPQKHADGGKALQNGGEPDLTGPYRPNNVRHLVQSFQQTVHESSPSPPPLPAGHSQPVPPPRRTRPVSAGTSRTYAPPPPYPGNRQQRPLSLFNSNNNSQSSEHDHEGQSPREARAGSTPPRSTQPGPGGPPSNDANAATKKNSIWYEYGCV